MGANPMRSRRCVVSLFYKPLFIVDRWEGEPSVEAKPEDLPEGLN